MEAPTPEHLRLETRDMRLPTDERDERRAPDRREGHEDDERGERHSDQSRDKADRAEEKKPTLRDRLRAHPWVIAAAIIVIILLIVATVIWWLNARQYESTDDAFIDTRTITISAQVSGAIDSVAVNDNQVVDAGALLMHMDDRVYRARVDQAQAQLDQAQAGVANLAAQIEAQQARIDQAKKQVEQAQATLTFAQEEFTRAAALAKSGSGTVQQEQQTRSNLLQNQATLSAAQANEVATQKQLAVLMTQKQYADAQLEAAKAVLNLAETNLSYTTITAPVAGRVTRLTAAPGTYALPGQALTMFVPRDIWVTANFKETQLTLMRTGQPVDLQVDAFPDRVFRGHIDSIQAGSGTAFSLLPAENATGNYVKVVQRVPIKIVFDKPPDVELGPGMSVVPTVKVR